MNDVLLLPVLCVCVCVEEQQVLADTCKYSRRCVDVIDDVIDRVCLRFQSVREERGNVWLMFANLRLLGAHAVAL
jgi:hypothetical protein